MRLAIILIMTLIINSCRNKKPNLTIVNDKFKLNLSKDSIPNYFPFDSLLENSSSDLKVEGYHVKKWARQVLFDLREPSLYNYAGEGQAVRLVWLPSFGNPVVVRINNFNDTVYVNVKEQKEYLEIDLPKIITDTIIELGSKEWKKVLSDLQINNFWKAKIRDSFLAKDGIAWFLEGRLNDRYYYIERWDEGNLNSRDLNLFAKELVDIGKGFVQMKSRK